MRRRPIAKRPEAAQKRELLRPEPGDIDKGLGPGQHCEQRQQKHLVERIHHLAALARVRQIVKIAQKNNGFSKGPTIRRGVHPRTPPSNQKGLDGFRTSRLCHPFLRPIALRFGSRNLPEISPKHRITDLYAWTLSDGGTIMPRQNQHSSTWA